SANMVRPSGVKLRGAINPPCVADRDARPREWVPLADFNQRKAPVLRPLDQGLSNDWRALEPVPLRPPNSKPQGCPRPPSREPKLPNRRRLRDGKTANGSVCGRRRQLVALNLVPGLVLSKGFTETL